MFDRIWHAASSLCVVAFCLAGPAVQAQQSPPSWLASADPALIEAARKEGALVVYSSTNEQEGLPLWKLFEEATGIKVSYVRGADVQLMGRMAIEHRAQQKAWDLVQTASVQMVPKDMLAAYEPPEARHLIPSARASDRRWYAVYANYNAPAYNTKFVKPEELPKTFDEFLARPQWAGKVAIDINDEPWLAAIYQHYGETKGAKLVDDLVTTLKPVVLNGHLALARAVGAGEYWIALNNFLNLTLNVKLAGQPTDFWVLDPVALYFGNSGIAANAPHPNAARLGQNFILSREAQTFLARFGRFPTREDVVPNPPGVLDGVKRAKVVPALLDGAEGRKWSKRFEEQFKRR